METPVTIPVQVTLEAKPVSPPWRLRAVYILQLIGMLLAFFGAADFLQLLAFLPMDFAKWLLVSGPIIATSAKPIIMTIGDVLDNGVKDDSFKIPLGLFLVASLALGGSFGLVSCAGMQFDIRTPYGDASSAKDGTISINPKPIAIPDRSGK